MQLAFDFLAPPAIAVMPAPAARAAPAPSAPASPADPARAARARRGQVNYHAGLAAEDSVARSYGRAGHRVARRRFRGRHGEVDLIVEDGEGFAFVEVKKGVTHDQALARVTRRQFHRIYAAATEFVEGCPKGQLTTMRFDVATVDAGGTVRLHPGILAHF